MLSETFIPCASKKYRIHNIWGIRSSTPTSDASVDIFVFSLCLFEAEYRATLTIYIIPLVWFFMSWCTANAVSTHHFTVLVPSDSKVNMRSLVPLRYFRMLPSFSSSSSLGSLTHVVKTPHLRWYPVVPTYIGTSTYPWSCGVPESLPHLIFLR